VSGGNVVVISVNGTGKSTSAIVNDVMRQWPSRAGRNEFGIRKAVTDIVAGDRR
jgi:hypothetical protein